MEKVSLREYSKRHRKGVINGQFWHKSTPKPLPTSDTLHTH